MSANATRMLPNYDALHVLCVSRCKDRSYASSAREAAQQRDGSRYGNSSSGNYSFSGNSTGGAGKYGSKYGKGKGGKGFGGGGYGSSGHGGGSYRDASVADQDYAPGMAHPSRNGGGSALSAGFGYEATCSMAKAMQRYGKSPQEVRARGFYCRVRI